MTAGFVGHSSLRGTVFAGAVNWQDCGYTVGINVFFEYGYVCTLDQARLPTRRHRVDLTRENFQYRAFRTPIYFHSLRTISDVLLTQSDSRTTELHIRGSGAVSRAVTAG